MGAPKQKWTAEEEAALKAGVAKHGPGKWSTILRDPEFALVLQSRSNVDLKDKWRNLSVMASGLGSRQRSRLAKSKQQPSPKPDDISTALARVECDGESSTPKSPKKSAGTLQKYSPIPSQRLDNLILETIANLKEPRGSRRAAIAAFIEENHSAPPDEKMLAAELKALTDCGKLIKVKHRYRIAPSSSYLSLKKNPTPFLVDARQEGTPMADMNAIKILTKAEIDEELEKMRSMTAQEAAAAAVKAVAEAEAAIAEAEKAAREAEAAEADAELAQVFAAAAIKALKQTALCT